MVKAERTDIVLKPDSRRVLFRPFYPSSPERITRIAARVLSLPESEVRRELDRVLRDFHNRHSNLLRFYRKRFDDIREHLFTDKNLSKERKLLVGAYFTQEYSLESAALFNPSMVWHPDQSGLPAGNRRFIISLRATGEGHISSITFRAGVIDAKGGIKIDEPSSLVTTPEVHPNPVYEKGLFSKKLFELGVWNDFARQVMDGLDDEFTLRDLERKVGYFKEKVRHDLELAGNVADAIVNLANSNYTVSYSQADDISQRIIFPTSPAERNGIEDARFVQFFEDDGSCTYYATYSAYDGRVVIPQMLETKDFLDFTISTLNGPQAQNKGMALFPRKINGNYAMISRQDNENIYIMFSDMPHFWYERKVLIKPTYPWEFVQLGNCGSPVETDAGWLVITHGVGPMRKYSIGAFLLDLEDPGKVIGRLNEPLLSANENEREGYVPNVVYSCGAQVHNGRLVIPYAMSDYASSFASVDLKKLLRELTRA